MQFYNSNDPEDTKIIVASEWYDSDSQIIFTTDDIYWADMNYEEQVPLTMEHFENVFDMCCSYCNGELAYDCLFYTIEK